METHAKIGLGQWIGAVAKRSPGRPALSFEGRTWTYGELVADVDQLAAALQAAGVAAGDRVGFLALNHALFFVALFASARIGAIFVPLNFRLTGPELEFIINDAGIHTLAVGPEHVALVNEIRTRLPCQRYLAIEGNPPGYDNVGSVMREASAVRVAVATDANDAALIMYTSGTTGRPKGAVLTHGNIWWNNVNALLSIDVTSDDVHLNFAPLFHIGGLNVLSLLTFMKGGHVVLHKSFNPAQVLQDVPRYRASTSFAVPAMLLFISQHADFAGADMSSLRFIVVGGAPVPEHLLRLFNARGIPVHQGYGLTETAPMVSFLAPEYGEAKLGSAGKAPLLTEFRLLDAEGAPIVEPGARGEVCVRGPNVMKAYWGHPEATREAIDDQGWFHTGDVGYVDADGFLYICDRIKDMVISGGENVYPAEVESVLFEHPAIAEVAVIGLPDDQWGEAVVAVAALKPGATLTLLQLQEFAGERLARYKIPRHLHLLAALPRNPTGKILKYRLREDLA